MSKEISQNNKRIAKNTIFLYFRMGLMIIVSLITSRVVLSTLGESDYGVYNVIGGFVAMFGIISGSLSSAISRFITFELGKGNESKLNLIFCTSINVQIIISAIILILCELIGIWFIDNKMNIPPDRIFAAQWVLQFSLLSFVLNLISVPYNATIIAHERMDAFAYICLGEAIVKLLVLYFLYISNFDKLILYSALLAIISFIVRLVYGIYCNKNFRECHYHLVLEKGLLKQMFSFSGWTFLGNSAGILNIQGVDILTNIFFGVKINAARGIATQVGSVLNQFASNFMTSINPQITKSYAANDFKYMHSLIFRSSKFGYFLYLFIAIPLFFETNTILNIWLKEVPEYSEIFVKWSVLISATLIFANSMGTANAATGEVKRYQLTVTVWGGLELPATYLVFKVGFSAVWAYILYFIVYFVLIFIRIYLVKGQIGMKASNYYTNVIIPVTMVTIVAILTPLIIISYIDESLLRLFLTTIFSSISTVLAILIFGFTKTERTKILGIIKNKM